MQSQEHESSADATGKKVSDKDDGEIGLMFMALCGDLSRQFEFVQQSWLNNSKHVLPYTNEVDPIAAGGNGSCPFTIPQLPLRRHVESVPKFVRVRGGGYFLLPSRTALQYMLS